MRIGNIVMELRYKRMEELMARIKFPFPLFSRPIPIPQSNFPNKLSGLTEMAHVSWSEEHQRVSFLEYGFISLSK
jgi:hypothetical protein